MKIVDILSHEQELARPLIIQLAERSMGGIRLDGIELGSARIVKSVDQIRVTSERLGSSDVFNPVAFPKAIRAAKGR